MANRRRKKAPPPEPSELIARIERYEQTYYISEDRAHQCPVSDEALIDVEGSIVSISPKLKKHLGRPIEISFGCARSYPDDERTASGGKPFLLPMNLRKERCCFMAYLPSAAFWSIPGMIDAGRVTHIAARFSPPRYGSGGLLSVFLAPSSSLPGISTL
jgi:hypothetical protein